MSVQTWTKSIALAAVAACAMSLSATSAAAQASSSGSNTFQVRAFVPVACWVRPASAVVAGAGLGGSVVEACNNPGGFTISASYRTLGTREKAKVRYADRLIDLSKTGMQELRRSSIATIRTVDYQFDEVELDEPLILALTIQPI